jgi:hypothetical protein
MAADRRGNRGPLLLTGSVKSLAARGVSETLAGRIALWPLSVGERRSVRETFVDSLFNPEVAVVDCGDLADAEALRQCDYRSVHRSQRKSAYCSTRRSTGVVLVSQDLLVAFGEVAAAR